MDSQMATDAFSVNLQSSHAFPCSPGLVGVEVEVDRVTVLLLK